MGIEPTYSAWEADVLPLNYTRISKLESISQSKVSKNSLGAVYSLRYFGVISDPDIKSSLH